ncbi:hypothetical protein F5Y17DRAFT_416272 [Xylariaceae sp. FL0594]|nr:hypothetical protein F5Y17DRAFT_416272 [Xylariaceae sp. FL0594]
MAPRTSQAARRQTQSTNEHIYALGKVGRRTGIELPESEIRDEHGFEEMNIFSSPEADLRTTATEPKPVRANVVEEEPSDQEEQDMEIDDGSEIGPLTARKLQQGRLSIPRGRSPMKTHLNSPARQNPHVGLPSSPVRGDVVTAPQRSPERTVTRRLDFSKSSQPRQPITNGASKTSAAKGHKEKLPNGHSQSTRHHEGRSARTNATRAEVEEEEEEEAEEEEEEEAEEQEQDDDLMELLEAAAVVDEEPEQEEEHEPEQEEERPVVQESKAANKSKPPGRRGRKPKAVVEQEQQEVQATDMADAAVPDPPVEEKEQDEEPVKRKKGRPKATAPRQSEEEPAPVPDPTPPKLKKRGRPARQSTEHVDESADEPREAKRQKTAGRPRKVEKDTSAKSEAIMEKAKPGRKRKSSGVGADSPKIQRGPPLPKARGLVTVRREEATAMKTTRSGRTSFKPLQWWKGDRVEYDEEQESLFTDAGNRHFKMPTVKGIVRTEELPSEATNRRRGRPPTGRKPGRRRSAIPEEEEEVEREDWEYELGRLEGDVVVWRPEHELDPPEDDDEVEIDRVDLAISENAIQLRDIKGATFKFAKTLTMPFFGSGIVELPPGAEKKTKNSRKMQLAFFVHAGNVRATVGKSEFGIAKGGMFFVPRGNPYSIRNETDRTARLFFAQGCEVPVQTELQEGETY